MVNNNTTRCSNELKIFISVTIVFLATFISFFYQYVEGTDSFVHMNWAVSASLDIIGFMKNMLSYPIWHYFAKLVFCMGMSENISVATTTAVFNALAYLASLYFIKVVVNSGDNFNTDASCLIALIASFVGPLYVPIFNDHYYLGQWSPNTWHNPTNIAVRPFAIIATALLISIIRTIWSKEQCVGKREYYLLSIFMVMSCFAKPSYMQGMVMGFSLFIIVSLLFYRNNINKNVIINYCKLCLSFLPAFIALVLQVYLTNTTNNTQTGGIGIGWGIVLHTYTSNMVISFVLALAFPLMVFLMNIRKILNNIIGHLLLCYLLGAWLESAVFYFKGKIGFGDFCWAYMIAMYIIWLSSLIYFFVYEDNMKKKVVCWIILFAHLISGILYWMQFAHLICPLTQVWDGLIY